MSNIGFRVLPLNNRASKEIIEQYSNFVTPHISDNINRLNSVNSSIRPIHTQGKLVGSALTVKTRPGDNLLVHKAIDMAEPGDVIMIDAGGDLSNAIMGEIMVRISKKKGINGFVVDGAIRDSKEIREMNYPLYSKGVTHRGPYKDGPGEINVPVQIGGTVVNPGDIVVGDMDGIVVVPMEEADDLQRKIQQTIEDERKTMESIENETVDRSWVNTRLREKGCEGV
ncbi:RraA family protein [Salibacterium qingdaonense]|uniref:Putative 4-hydroxy-4-methyl-2-oxoglutarate aldolase n=1 Tax=Salibacterium qingdaonense TaxID=266892 RepID=A0A1I4NU82_9BACI|nr:RraA family protein [Salibacterium qingdaonense]SFM18975.1 RraA famliy [Salibacterium qingdaonense]